MEKENLRLKKHEILSKRDDLKLLFTQNENFKQFPFKVLYRRVERTEGSPLKIGISIPKRLHKKAVNRNLLKRRCKEAYRLHRNSFKKELTGKEIEVHVMLIYISKEQCAYAEIEEKIILTLQRLQSIYAEDSQ